MLVRYMSDLHMEGCKFIFTNLTKDKDSVLVLAGDIHTGGNALPFLQEVCSKFKAVVYIFGNHEFYHRSIPAVRATWEKLLKTHEGLENLYLLDNKSAVIEGVRFIGTTLWTDLQNDNFVMYRAQQGMNDFKVISKGVDNSTRFTPMCSVLQHNAAVHFLETELSKEFNGTTIVVTHHLPSYVCLDPKYSGSPVNPAFASNLEWLMDKYSPEFWIHGHTHHCVMEAIYDTLVLANPKGYGRENKAFNPIARIDTELK